MPLSRRTRILLRWTAVLAGIAPRSAGIVILYGTAPADHALSGATGALGAWRRVDARMPAVYQGGKF